ncbi:zinc finger domain-containing protein, LSD1 subclass [Filimonas lacunae]|uniref:Zinc finger domain-containing protein, LSD1 subclass n=1 Tax=Filimonas lacunae TaxID=477680 RepID=A0A173MDK5_9BACT|nr:hypothetical protein [Filimonas lacunae]BAV05672.1 hypothetical protein FLA_1683 [Filimonas lacunae]SIT28955.1 zinc finger domain-containing protein, LSD1 subclass [Filimonas lacunae]
MPQAEQPATLNTSLQCESCGATLHFAPGTHQLKCTYCGATNDIPYDTGALTIVSYDYEAFIESVRNNNNAHVERVVSCKNCGAATTLPPEVNSENCTFCASPLVLNEAANQQIVSPHYVLPFQVTQTDAVKAFRTWLTKLWFAPNDLAKMATNESSKFKGMYLPHWSYDADTTTDYDGERGDYYYTTETYTETVNGKTETRTRQVRHTRWHYVSGTVYNQFTDIIVAASQSLPPKVSNRLEPWHMNQLVRYNEQYVSGFRSELYQVTAENGLTEAKRRMDGVIRNTIEHDIGGDEQRIGSYQALYENLALKYLLLPVWISAYKYNNKLYHFTVNASTGEVVGERPYSAAKIALAVLAAIGIIIFIAYCFSNSSN